jgi:hypothetical protein
MERSSKSDMQTTDDAAEIEMRNNNSGSSGSAMGGPGQCPICLQGLQDPTSFEHCPHTFCFDCIVEWIRFFLLLLSFFF